MTYLSHFLPKILHSSGAGRLFYIVIGHLEQWIRNLYQNVFMNNSQLYALDYSCITIIHGIWQINSILILVMTILCSIEIYFANKNGR